MATGQEVIDYHVEVMNRIIDDINKKDKRLYEIEKKLRKLETGFLDITKMNFNQRSRSTKQQR